VRHQPKPARGTRADTERRPRTSSSSTLPTGGTDSGATVAPRHGGPQPDAPRP